MLRPMPASGRPQSCPTHVRRPLLYFYSLSIFYSIPYASTIVFDFYSIYDTFFILVYIDSIYTASLMSMYDIFCNLTRPSSPITASLSLALDCRSLHLSLYDPAPGSSTRPLLAQPSLLAITLVPAWPRSPPKPSARTRPLQGTQLP